MFFRWIVIENSLVDKSVVRRYPILSETSFAPIDPARKSRLLKIRVPEQDVGELVDFMTHNIKAPYYCHFYHEDPDDDRLIVVFTNQTFNARKTDYKEASDYGISHGVSAEEMEIAPTNVVKEEW